MFLLVVYRHHTFPPSSITYELECILSKQPTLLIRTFVEQLMYLKNKYLCTSLQVGRAPHTIIPVVQLVVSWVSTSLILLFSRSVVSDSLRTHESQHARLPAITNSRSSLKLVSIESVMPSSHLILCRPLLLLPSVFPSIRVFFSESVLRSRWLKHWSFSFSIGPSNEYSGLISIRIDKVVQCIIGWMSTSFINGLIFGSATATLEMCWNPDSWSISHV